MRVLGLLLFLAPAVAQAQLTQKCEGQSWAALAAERYGDAAWGPLLARFNRAPGSETCEDGRFVRLIATVQHTVRLGQTVANIVGHLTRGPGAEALVREHNQLPTGQPKTGQILEIPAELELKLGSRPEAELAEIPGLPPLEVLRRYNGLSSNGKFTPGGTIYVPLFVALRPKAAPVAITPPPPPPPPTLTEIEAEPPPTGPSGPTTLPPPVAAPFQLKVKTSVSVAAIASPVGFEHRLHQALLKDEWQCELCHQAEPAQPDRYRAIPEQLCTQCHRGYEGSALRIRKLALTFSHAQHFGEKVKERGYEVTCDTCHAAEPEGGRRKMPAHETCVGCHNPSEVHPTVQAECSGCHGAEESPDRLGMARALLGEHYRTSDRGDDLRFGHPEHVAQFQGEQGCDRCHRGARESESVDSLEPQRMGDCLECHRGLERSLEGQKLALDRCQTCHYETRSERAPVFASVIDKPLSHTRTFRFRHQKAAEEDTGVCAGCHTELAGERGEHCDRCHQQSRPEDHGPRWREDPHGRSAVRNPDRCATCHQRDRCADCHAVAPRDHFPRQTFQLRHARQARVSLRRCQTCHLPQVDCARCHDVGFE